MTLVYDKRLNDRRSDAWKALKSVFGQASTPDSAEGAHKAPQSPKPFSRLGRGTITDVSQASFRCPICCFVSKDQIFHFLALTAKHRGETGETILPLNLGTPKV